MMPCKGWKRTRKKKGWNLQISSHSWAWSRGGEFHTKPVKGCGGGGGINLSLEKAWPF